VENLHYTQNFKQNRHDWLGTLTVSEYKAALNSEHGHCRLIFLDVLLFVNAHTHRINNYFATFPIYKAPSNTSFYYLVGCIKSTFILETLLYVQNSHEWFVIPVLNTVTIHFIVMVDESIKINKHNNNNNNHYHNNFNDENEDDNHDNTIIQFN
jgi:hypothetical protein